MADVDVLIAPDGSVRYIYSDKLNKALGGIGRAETRRASNVEPDGAKWKADMGPVGGPVKRGFKTRQAALDWEVLWLTKHWVPFPKSEAEITNNARRRAWRSAGIGR